MVYDFFNSLIKGGIEGIEHQRDTQFKEFPFGKAGLDRDCIVDHSGAYLCSEPLSCSTAMLLDAAVQNIIEIFVLATFLSLYYKSRHLSTIGNAS